MMKISKEKFNTALGNRLKRSRKRAGHSQEAMGHYLGLHQAAICRIERGEQEMGVYELFRALHVLGLRLVIKRREGRGKGRERDRKEK